MNHLESIRTYQTTLLDDVEDFQQYRVGSFHPVNLHDIIVGR